MAEQLLENKTQCPNCLSIFVISDEQFQKSHGKVRCGSCREPFKAVLTKSTQSDIYTSNKIETDDLAESTSQRHNFEFDDDFHSELSIVIDDEDSIPDQNNEEFDEPKFVQTEFDLPIKKNQNPVPKIDRLKEITKASDDDELSKDDDFINKLNPVRDKNWFATLLLGVFCLILLCGLIYQLWHRQALPWLDDENLVNIIEPIAQPIVGLLSESLGVKLPIRKDLKNLQLLSARTEAHPNRSSTILLRVSLINHSEISQPYPWLELSLTDENGRLIARRSLTPDNYLHNNQVDGFIGARELRPVTIEFLSFPKQAHGYELKILNN